MKLYVPTQEYADKVSLKFPGSTIEELTNGKELFITKCKKCHDLPKPGKYTPDKWAKIMLKMKIKAKLDDANALLVEKYLVGAAKKNKQ